MPSRREGRWEGRAPAKASVVMAILLLLMSGGVAFLRATTPAGMAGIGQVILWFLVLKWTGYAGRILGPLAVILALFSLGASCMGPRRRWHVVVSTLVVLLSICALAASLGPALVMEKHLANMAKLHNTAYMASPSEEAVCRVLEDCEEYAFYHESAYPVSFAELQQWARDRNRALKTPAFEPYLYLGAGVHDASRDSLTEAHSSTKPSRYVPGLITVIMRKPLADGRYVIGYARSSPFAGAAQAIAPKDLPTYVHICDQQRARIGLSGIREQVARELGISVPEVNAAPEESGERGIVQ